MQHNDDERPSVTPSRSLLLNSFGITSSDGFFYFADPDASRPASAR
jgi:hypothetical protein